ncbi:MAG: hypothetical protein Q4E05_06150 [Pseudoclavibacter sp.]|nr:hypothetical protein [Pseudoclavibacter sp.]
MDLTVPGSVMTSNVIPPNVRVNGRPLNVGYGRHSIPVPAGPVRVEADVQWLLRYGRASLDFQLAPGQTVPVFYAAPMHQFSRGNMGHVEQKRPGMIGFVITLGVVAAVLLGLIGLVVAFG